MINAVVLAAGQSRRMGMPKPLLRFGNTTFLGQIVSVLRRACLGRITVVLGAGAEAIAESVGLSGTRVVVNLGWQDGQLSSLIAALREVPAEAEAMLLCLADNPFITPEIVKAVVGAFRRTGSPIVIPVHGGRRGHPALFARSMFDELLNAPASEGARYVVHANRDKVLELDVPTSAVLTRIDTPQDYVAHFGVEPQVIPAQPRVKEESDVAGRS